MKTKKAILLVLALFSIFFLAGCQKAIEESAEKSIESETGQDTEVDITGTSGEGPDWCREGEEWGITSTQQGENIHWIIQGLKTSGKYEGLCHVVYTRETEEGTEKIDYYFSEDGESGYVEMESNGQTFTQEWHGS